MLMDLFPLLYVQDGCMKSHAFFTLPVTLFFFFFLLVVAGFGLSSLGFYFRKKKKENKEREREGKKKKRRGNFIIAKIAKIIEDGIEGLS